MDMKSRYAPDGATTAIPHAQHSANTSIRIITRWMLLVRVSLHRAKIVLFRLRDVQDKVPVGPAEFKMTHCEEQFACREFDSPRMSRIRADAFRAQTHGHRSCAKIIDGAACTVRNICRLMKVTGPRDMPEDLHGRLFNKAIPIRVSESPAVGYISHRTFCPHFDRARSMAPSGAVLEKQLCHHDFPFNATYEVAGIS